MGPGALLEGLACGLGHRRAQGRCCWGPGPALPGPARGLQGPMDTFAQAQMAVRCPAMQPRVGSLPTMGEQGGPDCRPQAFCHAFLQACPGLRQPRVAQQLWIHLKLQGQHFSAGRQPRVGCSNAWVSGRSQQPLHGPGPWASPGLASLPLLSSQLLHLAAPSQHSSAAIF